MKAHTRPPAHDGVASRPSIPDLPHVLKYNRNDPRMWSHACRPPFGGPAGAAGFSAGGDVCEDDVGGLSLVLPLSATTTEASCAVAAAAAASFSFCPLGLSFGAEDIAGPGHPSRV